MSRIRLPSPETMTAEQRKVHDAAMAGRRGVAPAPLLAWLASPEFADRAQRLGEFVRYETTLAPRLSELAILVVARHWTSQYEWAVHKREAVKAGVAPDVIDAIARRRSPEDLLDDERAVFAFATVLNESRRVPDAIYRAVVAAIGERGVVELVGILGYYSLISMTINAFDIEVPADLKGEALPS
jgi:4-carboxymuconolactone decarboxylase